jgi:hypothetical protein
MSTCRCACAGELELLRGSVARLELVVREVQSLQRTPVARPVPTASRDDYDQVLAELPGLVQDMVPAGGRVLVVSRGDDRLTAVDGRTCGHFPQTDDGAYAGHHPHDSEAAVAELERLRADGWRYLVFPLTALWWLDHYAGLRRHLETSGRLLVRRDGLGVVYGLYPPAPPISSPPAPPVPPEEHA